MRWIVLATQLRHRWIVWRLDTFVSESRTPFGGLWCPVARVGAVGEKKGCQHEWQSRKGRQRRLDDRGSGKRLRTRHN